MKSAETKPSVIARVYSERGETPRAAARDDQQVAEDIIRSSRKAGIYAHQSPSLVALLMKVNLDAQVPPLLYTATAELLVWLHQIDTAAAPPAASARQEG
jgi:flagellar biosynthesis protein